LYAHFIIATNKEGMLVYKRTGGHRPSNESRAPLRRCESHQTMRRQVDKHPKRRCSASIECLSSIFSHILDDISKREGTGQDFLTLRNLIAAQLGRTVTSKETAKISTLLRNRAAHEDTTNHSTSPPMNIGRKNNILSIDPINASIPVIATRAQRLTQQSLECGVISKSMVQKVSMGCLKEKTSLNPRDCLEPSSPVLDELRSCQNCASKYYANKTNCDTSGFFCSGECMWSSILNN
jgi:hypothetical protein